MRACRILHNVLGWALMLTGFLSSAVGCRNHRAQCASSGLWFGDILPGLASMHASDDKGSNSLGGLHCIFHFRGQSCFSR